METDNFNTAQKQIELAKKYAENQAENLKLSHDATDWTSILNGRGRNIRFSNIPKTPSSQNNGLITNKSKLKKYHIDLANKMLNVGGDSIFGGALSKPMSAKSTKSIFSFGTFSNQSSNLLDRYTKMYQNKKKATNQKSEVLDSVAFKYSGIASREMEKITQGRDKMASQPMFLVILIAMVGLYLFFSMM